MQEVSGDGEAGRRVKGGVGKGMHITAIWDEVTQGPTWGYRVDCFREVRDQITFWPWCHPHKRERLSQSGRVNTSACIVGMLHQHSLNPKAWRCRKNCHMSWWRRSSPNLREPSLSHGIPSRHRENTTALRFLVSWADLNMVPESESQVGRLRRVSSPGLSFNDIFSNAIAMMTTLASSA
jgi:hypothetical protein